MRVRVTMGVQEPDKVDLAQVCAELPRGPAPFVAVHGGPPVQDPEQDTLPVIATAAVEAFLPIDPSPCRLSASAPSAGF